MTTAYATATIAVGLGLAVLGSSACVARLIGEPGVCGDGTLDPGEICLGQGAESELTIEGIEGLVLRVADFNGDAHLDLLVLGTAPDGTIASRLWPGRGDGTFDDARDPGLAGCSAYGVAGDMDGDTARDVLIDDCGPTVSVFLGTPSSQFTAPSQVFTGVETRSSGLLDLDDDGQREVVVLGSDTAGTVGLSISEREGQGGFAPPIYSPVGQTGSAFDPFGLGFIDLDRDDIFDALLVHSGQPGGLALARGEPGLRFASPEPVGPADLVLKATMVRDLDEDEVPDVLAFSFDEEALIFLRGEPGELVERRRTSVPGLRTGPAGAGDIDADGHLDLLLFEPDTGQLQAWFGQGDGGFEGPEAVDLDTPVAQIALVDLDEDGALDIVVGTFSSGTLRIMLSDP